MSAKRRKQKKNRASGPPVIEPLETAVPKPPRPVITTRRKWLFRIAAMIIPVVLFFALLEAGLRLGGYGYPTSFFIGPDAKGICATNNRFGWRFFPRAIARQPQQCFISAKPSGSVRIFVLGSSAAQGIPDPAFSFGRILEVMLQAKYPDTRFEVENVAMTAINSHVALEIARDCAAHQPDLFIVYMGNNEVIGPYGPGSVFQQWSPSLSFIRASIWVKATRIGQLIGDVAGCFHAKKDLTEKWRGMQTFLGNPVAADDPRLVTLYANYRQNLIDICEIARRAGAGVIISTVATNLKDCPPLDSLHRPDLDADGLAKWDSLYHAGIELEVDGRWLEAIAQFEAAALIDDRFADLQFRLGRCFAAAGRFSEARDHFILARDRDVLRFRADSHINTILRDVAAEQKTAGVRLVDVEKALAESALATNGILGENLFFEHVHMTFAGNYLLAQAILDQVCEALPKAVRSGQSRPVPTRQQCADMLAFTPWDEYKMADAIVKSMTSQPPFTNQLDHAIRQAKAREATENLRRLASTPHALQQAWSVYEAALRKSPDNWDLHCHFANLALQAGQPDVAIEHMQIAVEKLPEMRINLGIMMNRCGRSDEAIAQYRKVLETEPNNEIAFCNLGVALLGRGQIKDGLAHLQKALELKPDYAEAHGNLGAGLAGLGRTDESIAHLQKAVEFNPDYAEAHSNLGFLLAGRGQAVEGIAHLQKALELEPDYVDAHNNIGLLLTNCGQLDEALVHYRKALDLKPNYVEAHYNMGLVLARRGQLDEALVHFRKALELKPNYAEAHNTLGEVLFNMDRTQEAISHFERALQLLPDNAKIKNNLSIALASANGPDATIRRYEESIKLNPNNTEAYNNLAWLLATRDAGQNGNPGRAIELAERACKLAENKSASYLDTLSVAYAAAGRFPDAISTAQKAIQLAADSGQTKLADKIKGRLELYRAGHAYNEQLPPKILPTNH
jgi:tetratricopeptide (TPR) repeat protein